MKYTVTIDYAYDDSPEGFTHRFTSVPIAAGNKDVAVCIAIDKLHVANPDAIPVKTSARKASERGGQR